jgi:predicted lipoprotein with Yx(FWY)xxD motif
MHLRTFGALVAVATLTLTAACGGDDTESAPPTTEAATAVASAQLADSSLGEILVDGAGNTLYGFTNDADGTPTCTGGCATAWPAQLIEGDPALGEGLDAGVFTLVEGAGGGQQLKAGKWPLYRFSGDEAPGDVNGQGSGGVWFAVGADGSLLKDASADASAGSGDGAGGGDGY